MSKKTIIAGIAAIGIMVIAIIVLHKNPMEKFIDRAVEAFELENRAAVHNLISDTYLNRYGWERTRVDDSLGKLFDMFNDFSVIIDTQTTERLSDHEGRVTLELRVVATIAQGVKAAGGVDLNVYGNQRFYLVGTPPSTSGSITFLLAREDDTWRLVDIIDVNVGYPIPNEASGKTGK